MLAVIGQVKDYEREYSMYVSATRNFIEEMEATGRRYYVTTVKNEVGGLQALMYKCMSSCVSAPSFN